MSRMAGAWVIGSDEPTRLNALTQDRYLVGTPAGMEVYRSLQSDTGADEIDLGMTLVSIEDEIDCLRKKFEEAAAKSKSRLIEPSWPRPPRPLNLEAPPADASAPAEVAVVLGIARWLEALAMTWEAIEQQRMMRKYLRGKDAGRRRLPVKVPRAGIPNHR
ncbi:hypothetical protein B1R94_20880 [Mycolicibacterium litorale]|nr:hypothetical protein B1R94_20880 [Mycolicibacterium litorale]